MSYTSWHVGMKVVCIKDSGWDFLPLSGEVYPQFGECYTIRELLVDGGDICLRLAEIENPRHSGKNRSEECAFIASRFRPVQKRITDISIFTRLLTDPHVRISEDA